MKTGTFLAVLAFIGASAAIPVAVPRPAVEHSIRAAFPPKSMVENQDWSFAPTPTTTGEQMFTIQTSMTPPMKTLVTREAGRLERGMVHAQTTMSTAAPTASEKEEPMFSIQTDPPHPQKPGLNIPGWPLMPPMVMKPMATGIVPGYVMQEVTENADAMSKNAGEVRERTRERWWPDVHDLAHLGEIEELRAKGWIGEGPVNQEEVVDREMGEYAEERKAWLREQAGRGEEVEDDGEPDKKWDWEAAEELDDEADEDYEEYFDEEFDEGLNEDVDEEEAEEQAMAEGEQ